MIKINGEFFDFDGLTVAEYIKNSDFDSKRIAVELNEEFLPKSSFSETVLKDGDVLEVVSFVGGG